MRQCFARCRQRVQCSRFHDEKPPQLVERAEARHGRRHLTHHSARDGIENPPRQQHAWSAASLLDRRAAEQTTITMRLDGELASVKWMPGVDDCADIVSPRIML
jgi:hypothetical protein